MYRSITLEEDLALKQVIADRRNGADSNHRFSWRESISTEYRTPIPEIIVTRTSGEQQFSLADVADSARASGFVWTFLADFGVFWLAFAVVLADDLRRFEQPRARAGLAAIPLLGAAIHLLTRDRG